MKKYMIIMGVLLLLAGCAGEKEKEEDPIIDEPDIQEPEGGNDVEDGVFHAVLKNEYGRLRLYWDDPEEGYSMYEVSLEIPEGEDWVSVYKNETYRTVHFAEDYVNYYCQESGYSGKVRFTVTVKRDGEETARDTTEAFDSSECYPEKEVLEFNGKSIPDDLLSFSYSGNGDSVEANFSYGVVIDDGEVRFSSHTYSSLFHSFRDKEKKLKKKDWEELLSLIEKGSIVRNYYMDPEIEILDGSSSGFTITWESESIWEEYNYHYKTDPENRQALIDWFEKH